MNQRAETVYRAGRADISWREAGDEIVILDTASSVYFGLDRSGALLWRHLTEGATAGELVAVLTTATTVDSARAAGDLDAFLAALLRHRLIQRS